MCIGKKAWRPRIAFELSGCLRNLETTGPLKLAAIESARKAGLAVDLYCAMEACSSIGVDGNGTLLYAEDVVTEFVKSFSKGDPCSSVHCTWWAAGSGALQAAGTDRLKPEHRRFHPAYPYSSSPCNVHKMCSVDATLSMAFQLNVVGGLREQSGIEYLLAWRNRPDFYTTGHNWSKIAEVIKSLRANIQQQQKIMIASTTDKHQRYDDVEGLLPIAAASHYDRVWFSYSSLYSDKLMPFHPEHMLHAHMQQSGFLRDFDVLNDVKMIRCRTLLPDTLKRRRTEVQCVRFCGAVPERSVDEPC